MSLEVIKFEGSFRAAIIVRIRVLWRGGFDGNGDWRPAADRGPPNRVEVNVDDWIDDNAHGECLRFPLFDGERTCVDAYPSPYVPRGSLLALWREPLDPKRFPGALWSKWWYSEHRGAIKTPLRR